MPTEEIVTIAVSKLINLIIILITAYFWLVINHIKKDINNVANFARETREDVEKNEEILTCLKVAVGKLEQQVQDCRESCKIRYRKK